MHRSPCPLMEAAGETLICLYKEAALATGAYFLVKHAPNYILEQGTKMACSALDYVIENPSSIPAFTIGTTLITMGTAQLLASEDRTMSAARATYEAVTAILALGTGSIMIASGAGYLQLSDYYLSS